MTMPDTTPAPAAVDPMLAAAAADGLDADADFGPLDRDAWEETVGKHWPDRSGLLPGIAPVAVREGVLEWDATLARATPHGPDIVDCGRWSSQRLAWAACVAQCLVMCWYAVYGQREKAEAMFTRRAPRPATAEAAA
jgi:hypothetical protein